MAVFVCVCCKNKELLPKACKGHHALLILSARSKPLESVICRKKYKNLPVTFKCVGEYVNIVSSHIELSSL